jgi:hypothetical protein
VGGRDGLAVAYEAGPTGWALKAAAGLARGGV